MNSPLERRRDYPNILDRLTIIEVTTKHMDKRINGSIDRIEQHIAESDKTGGYRDRLAKLETLFMKTMDDKAKYSIKAQWRVGIITGLPATILAILYILELINK